MYDTFISFTIHLYVHAFASVNWFPLLVRFSQYKWLSTVKSYNETGEGSLR